MSPLAFSKIRAGRLLLLLVVAMTLGSAAQGGILVYWQFVTTPPNPAEIAADPRLGPGSYGQSWDLIIQTTGGDDWLSIELHADISDGTFYDSNVGDSRFLRQSSWSGTSPRRFDTAVGGPLSDGIDPFVLGGFQLP